MENVVAAPEKGSVHAECVPSRHAHQAALRRSKEPHVIAPQALNELPLLPAAMGWRNPVRDYDYDRSEWHIFIVLPHASVVLASIKQLPDLTFEVRAGEDCAHFDGVLPAFVQSVAWAKARFDQPSSYVPQAERLA